MLLLFVLIFLFDNGHAASPVNEIINILTYAGPTFYYIIYDAGSTGCRVHIFEFKRNRFDSKDVKLVTEYYKALRKGGLGPYASNPEKGGQYAVDLIKSAIEEAPFSIPKNTSIMLRATAGLRLLPTKDRRKLLDTVEKAIKLNFEGEHTVAMLAEEDEGIYNWFTCNYLLGSIDKDSRLTLDMGGSSTQITYVLDKYDADIPATSVLTRTVGNRNITWLSHSYLNLGASSAAIGTFRSEMKKSKTNKLTSVCVHPEIKNYKWTHNGEEFHVSGASRKKIKSMDAFNRCYDVIRKYVKDTMDWEPSELPDIKVVAVDGYFFFAAQIGILGEIDLKQDQVSGVIKLEDYRNAALTSVKLAAIEGDPFFTFKLILAYTLLHDGYKMKDSVEIELIYKMDGFRASWPLGMALSIMNEKIREECVIAKS